MDPIYHTKIHTNKVCRGKETYFNVTTYIRTNFKKNQIIGQMEHLGVLPYIYNILNVGQ